MGGSRPHSGHWQPLSAFAATFNPRRDLPLRYTNGSAPDPVSTPVNRPQPTAGANSALDRNCDVAPSFYPALSSFLAGLSLPPMLDRPAGRFQGVNGHRGLHAGGRLTSDIGVLFPIAL